MSTSPTESGPPDPVSARSTVPVALDQPFDAAGLVALRSAVAAHGAALGLPDGRCDMLVLVANELATNAIAHGGGRGRLILWSADAHVYCEVSDYGPGLSPDVAARPQRPPLGAVGGRGLWLVRTLTDWLDVQSDANGTTVTAALGLATND